MSNGTIEQISPPGWYPAERPKEPGGELAVTFDYRGLSGVRLTLRGDSGLDLLLKLPGIVDRLKRMGANLTSLEDYQRRHDAVYPQPPPPPAPVYQQPVPCKQPEVPPVPSVIPSRLGPHGQLSGRERQVMVLGGAGMTNREIAKTLGIKLRTVETYWSRAKGKLDLRTTIDVVRWLIEQGLA